MPIIPDKKVEQLEFCEAHYPVWLTSFAAIGLTNAQCTNFKNLTNAARMAYDKAQAAKQAYRAAVTIQNNTLSQAVGNAGDLIRIIKGFAELSGNPDAVFGIAEIPPPSAPVPASAPGKPTDIAVNLEPSGAITLTWDAANASAGSGGFFNISRKLPGQVGFGSIGGSPGSTSQNRRMSFTDFEVPTSAAQTGAQYIIQGRRGTMVGDPSDAITVQFGVDGVGGIGLNLEGGESMKLAA